VHERTPDVASLPENATSTGARYHPLPSGGRPAAPPATTGAVLSMLTVAGTHVHVPPTCTPQSQVTTPSAVSVSAIGQLSLSATAGLGNQRSTTSVVCQPVQSAGPGVHENCTTCASALRAPPAAKTTASASTIEARTITASSGVAGCGPPA
jgi:hypothetical protein